MSPPTSTYSTLEDLDPNIEPKQPFKGVFENWLILQQHTLEKLKSAIKFQPDPTHSNNESTRKLRQLVRRVINQYEKYYQAKSESAKHNILQMITPQWLSCLEGAFLWIGGWRPSMAFHLLYSVSGLQLEARLSELLDGLPTGDLGDLSSSQLKKVNELQSQTIKEERELTENFAAQQETVADSPMVVLSHVATELTRDPDSLTREGVGSEAVSQRVESTLGDKEDKLEEIFRGADDLRLRTLRNVVDILSPIQAVYFLIAAAELHLRVHDWGVKKDAGSLGD